MKTLLNEEILEDTLGILYICKYQYPNLKVVNSLQFDCPGTTLEYYSEIPNPESQMAAGGTREEFLLELSFLHGQMTDPAWQKELNQYL